MQELDDEALGWFSRKLPWGSYGMLARASLTAPNLGVALKRWCRHHRLLTDDIALSLSISGAVATLAVDERSRLGPMREFCLVTTLRNVHGLRVLVDRLAHPAAAGHVPIRRAAAPRSLPAAVPRPAALRRGARRLQLRRAVPRRWRCGATSARCRRCCAARCR
jgi:hypothetical protein